MTNDVSMLYSLGKTTGLRGITYHDFMILLHNIGINLWWWHSTCIMSHIILR